MDAKDVLRLSMGLGENVLTKYVGDLSDEDLRIRPAPGMNPIAWQLGHLILTEYQLIEAVQPGASPKLPEGFEANHAKEAGQADDMSRYLGRDEYLRLFKAQREASKAALDALPAEKLDAPNGLGWDIMPTIGSLFALVGNHILLHAGQFVPVRRLQGKPVVI